MNRHSGRNLKSVCLTAALVMGIVLPTNTVAQSAGAKVSGTVIDSSGALVPGVKVDAANIQTGIATTVVTNESGAYEFVALQAGAYRISAALPGFRTQTHNDVVLDGEVQVRLSFKLVTTSTPVEVSMSSEKLLESLTQSGPSCCGILPARVMELPVVSQQVLDLLLMFKTPETRASEPPQK